MVTDEDIDRVHDRLRDDPDFVKLCYHVDLQTDNYVDDDIIDLGIYLQARGNFERPSWWPKRGTPQAAEWAATFKAKREGA